MTAARSFVTLNTQSKNQLLPVLFLFPPCLMPGRNIQKILYIYPDIMKLFHFCPNLFILCVRFSLLL